MPEGKPARLIGYFARGSPVCVIARRGPTRYSRLILWDTENDTFTPGQWFRGHLQYATMTNDGRYMAIGIMGARPRYGENVEQVAVICRPPYITALEAWFGGLCVMGLAFLPNDDLVLPSKSMPHKMLATSNCPFKRIEETKIPGAVDRWLQYDCDHDWIINAQRGPALGVDQKRRLIAFEDGCVFVEEGEQRRLLFDTNPMKFEKIEAPDWARDW
jgi:hypothetical protein